MRAVVVIMLVFVALLTFLARSYLEPYGTPGGQLILCVVLACWGGSIWIMARIARTETVERFFVGRADQ
jgi:hypothetical protein